MKAVRTFAVALSLALAPCVAFAQDPLPQDPPAGGGRGGRAAEPQIRPFDQVITKEAKSDEGVFTVHRIKDRVYYEIPAAALGVTGAATSSGAGTLHAAPVDAIVIVVSANATLVASAAHVSSVAEAANIFPNIPFPVLCSYATSAQG